MCSVLFSSNVKGRLQKKLNIKGKKARRKRAHRIERKKQTDDKFKIPLHQLQSMFGELSLI